MATKKAVVTFDDRHFTVYGDDKLLVSVPSAVVRKKSSSPVAVAFGNDAIKMAEGLQEGLMFSRPFSGNTISDLISAKLMVRYFFKKLFGINHAVEIYILMSSGISAVSRSQVEQVFISSGYRNVYIIERPYLLAKIAEQKGFRLVVDVEEATAEVALCDGGKPVQAHSINIGFRDVERDLTEELCNKFELSPCIKKTELNQERTLVLSSSAELPVLTCCSLNKADYTPIKLIGQDVISGENKVIALTAKDLFPVVEKPYKKTSDLLGAMLMGCDERTMETTVKSGILYLGAGTRINGFSEYMYEKSGLPVYVDGNPFMQVKTLYGLLDDSGFINYCLGFAQ